MRRLVLSVLVALGLLVATPALADAKSTSELTYSTVTTGPNSEFDGTCDYVLSWTVKDPSKVARYWYDIVTLPPQFPFAQPKNKSGGDLPYLQTQTGVLTFAAPPGTVFYSSVLVEYTNGTYSPWQYDVLDALPPC